MIRRGREPADSRAPLPLFESLRGGTGLLLATTLLAGCGDAPLVVPVDCRVVEGAVPSPAVSRSPGAEPSGRAPRGDTVQIRLTLDRTASSAGGRVMVRVDPLAEPGAVAFTPDVPPTSVAVSATVTTSGVFHGCLGAAPLAFELAAPAVPKGRVWVRVSSDRAVLLKVVADGAVGGRVGTVGGRLPSDLATLVEVAVSPGRSAEAMWRGGGTAP